MRSLLRSGYVVGFALAGLCSACFVDTTDDSTGGADDEVTGSPTTGDSATSVADAPPTDAGPGDADASGGDTGMPTATTTATSTTSATNAVTTDPPTTADSGTDDTNGTETGGGTIEVDLVGCDVDFGGTVVVSYNGSLGVASVYDGSDLTGSFQFELDVVAPEIMELSTQHRVDTGNVVNMVSLAEGTWTNLDAMSLAGSRDRIGGQLVINEWEPAEGIADIELLDVSLLNVSTDEVCLINGVIVTTEIYP